MIQVLLYVLAGGVCACVMMAAHQELGLWRNPVVCFLGGVLFTLLLSIALPMPDPLKFGATFVFGTLLFVQGRCQHTAPNAEESPKLEAEESAVDAGWQAD